jgi:hypothetical protein
MQISNIFVLSESACCSSADGEKKCRGAHWRIQNTHKSSGESLNKALHIESGTHNMHNIESFGNKNKCEWSWVQLNYTYLRCHYLDRIYFVWALLIALSIASCFACVRFLLCVCERERDCIHVCYIYVCSESSIKLLRILHERVALYMCYACVLLPPRPILNLYVSRKNRSNARLSSLNQSPNSWRVEKYLNLNPRL